MDGRIAEEKGVEMSDNWSLSCTACHFLVYFAPTWNYFEFLYFYFYISSIMFYIYTLIFHIAYY